MATGVALEIKGLREFGRALKAIDSDLPKTVRLALNEVADQVVDRARPAVPVRSGRARSSLKAKSTRTKARVSGGSKRVPYYGWLDFGGRVGPNGSQVRPFLRRGRYIYAAYFKMRESGEIVDLMDGALRKVIERAGLEVE